MKILFVHQNFPGQFKYLAPALAQTGVDIVALRQGCSGIQTGTQSVSAGVKIVGWEAKRGTTISAHPWAQDTETKLIRAEAAASRCEELVRQGWEPDLIVGHPGWGEMLFLKHLWPQVAQLHFLEFHYGVQGLDVGFDPEFFNNDWRTAARVTAKTGPGLINLELMEAGLSPTHFQARTYPEWAQKRIHIIHDGIKTENVKPNSAARLKVKEGVSSLRPGDPVITFINRNLEPYRGYHRFMRALPAIQKACPNAVTIIIGGDGVSYGAAAPEGKSWKQIYLDEVRQELDLNRIVFAGNVDYGTYLTVLQVSACHIYFTYPFVLGWSCLEAMACGALVVGSATPPVEEVITDGVNGCLVDFFDEDKLVSTVVNAIQRPEHYLQMRKAARETIVKRYDLNTLCLPAQIDLVKSLASARIN